MSRARYWLVLEKRWVAVSVWGEKHDREHKDPNNQKPAKSKEHFLPVAMKLNTFVKRKQKSK